MSKGLKALKTIKNCSFVVEGQDSNSLDLETITFIEKEDWLKPQFTTIEKELKTLEIIKEIMPIEKEDFFYDKETDTYFFIGYKVSKKQYDLLREVFLWD